MTKPRRSYFGRMVTRQGSPETMPGTGSRKRGRPNLRWTDSTNAAVGWVCRSCPGPSRTEHCGRHCFVRPPEVGADSTAYIVHREYISVSLSWLFFFLHVYINGGRRETCVCVDIKIYHFFKKQMTDYIYYFMIFFNLIFLSWTLCHTMKIYVSILKWLSSIP